jgi:cell wall-associated NlpC family hydrolase
MSLEAAISRIDQIQQLQQQLLTGSAGGSSATAASGGVGLSPTAGAVGAAATDPTTATGSGTNQAAFATALADAQAASASASAGADGAGASATGTGSSSLTDPLSSGVLDSLSPAALSTSAGAGGSGLVSNDIAAMGGLGSVGGSGSIAGLTGGSGSIAGLTGGADAAGSAPAAVQSMLAAANSLVGKPYVWGGGHSGWGPSAGYDCSGFVSAVLHAGGYLSSPQDTQTLPSSPGIESGPGQYVTIYDRTDAGSSDDHVIINIGGQFYESGGESGSWGGGGGVARIGTPPASYLATFNQILHPAGL